MTRIETPPPPLPGPLLLLNFSHCLDYNKYHSSEAVRCPYAAYSYFLGTDKFCKSDRREAIGQLGNIEHLRKLLPDELALTTKANQMYWLTDRTPHESLPLKEGTYRQFFRLVMSQVGLWYKDHSTPNPKGVLPDPKITKIVKGNKFDSEGVEIVDI